MTTTIFCAWCRDGLAAGGTPEGRLALARRHVHACPAHPASKLELENAQLRQQLRALPLLRAASIQAVELLSDRTHWGDADVMAVVLADLSAANAEAQR